MLIAGAGLLIAALVIVGLGGQEFAVRASGAPGQKLAVSGTSTATAEIFTDVEVSETDCTVGERRWATGLALLPGGPIVVEGRSWFRTGRKVEVSPGLVVECAAPPAGRVLLVELTGRTRTIKAALFACAGLGGLAMGGLGLTLAKRRRARV